MPGIGLTNTSFDMPEDQRWLAVPHLASKNNRGITLAPASFLVAFPTGIVPSSVVVGKITSGADTGKYGKYDNAAVDGRGTAAGLLYTYVNLGVNLQSPTGSATTAALFDNGIVVEPKLHALSGIDAAAKTDLPFVQFLAA